MNERGKAEAARFEPSRGKLVVMVVGLAVFTALAAWVLAITPAEAREDQGSSIVQVALWAVVVLCPAYALDLGLRLSRRTPTVEAIEEGVILRSVMNISAVVRWDEIETFAPVEMGRKPWLAIYLRDPVETMRRLGTGARLTLAKSHAKGVPNFAFRSIQLGTSPEKAAETLERIRRRRAGHGRQESRR